MGMKQCLHVCEMETGKEKKKDCWLAVGLTPIELASAASARQTPRAASLNGIHHRHPCFQFNCRLAGPTSRQIWRYSPQQFSAKKTRGQTGVGSLSQSKSPKVA